MAIAVGAALNVVSSLAPLRWSIPSVIEDGPYQLLTWSAVALCWMAVLRRRAWHVATIAVAISLWAVGDLVWDLSELVGHDPGTGAADVAYLAGYPLLALGIWRLVLRVSEREERTAALLDGVLVATMAGVLLWELFGEQAYGENGALFARVVATAYPMLDVVLVACCVWLAFTPARSALLARLAGLIALTLGADLLFAFGTRYERPGWLAAADTLYPLANLCGAAACWTAPPSLSPAPQRRALQRGRVVLLGFAFAVLPASYAMSAGATTASAVVAGVAGTIAFARLAGAAVTADRRHAELDQAVSALQETRAALTREATRDALTGLANRRVLLGHLASVSESGMPSVVFCDLDRFKPTNDGYGHHTGDMLLVAVAKRLERLDVDLVARTGGDEFVLVVNDGDEIRTRVAAAGTLACVTGPVALDGVTVEVSGSVGVATADAVGADPTRLVRDADLAMYAAKSTGGGGISYFDPALSRAAEARARLEAGLRSTIAGAEGRFGLAWQPIVDGHGRVVGREALLRWWHDDRWRNPLEFVAVAEEAGLLGPISDAVMRSALEALSGQARAGDPTLVAVNIAGSQLTHQGFVAVVAEMLREYGVDPAQLCIEVTEETLSGSVSHVTENLVALAEMGVRLAIDDFGAGATSIAHLRQLPFHYVKLDRAFVSSVEHDPLERRLLADLIQLIHGIGRVVVVEGIETAAEERVARTAGADLFQGFRFGRPVLELPDQDGQGQAVAGPVK